jgi:hypothetical protein
MGKQPVKPFGVDSFSRVDFAELIPKPGAVPCGGGEPLWPVGASGSVAPEEIVELMVDPCREGALQGGGGCFGREQPPVVSPLPCLPPGLNPVCGGKTRPSLSARLA